MFWPLEELIHAYFARTRPIATCENQLDGGSATQMSMSLKGLSSRKDLNKIERTHPLPRSKDEILVIKACFSDGPMGGDGLFM